jgi:pyruvate/2-oxoglutarate/acetoin dehydrogenase E1 component
VTDTGWGAVGFAAEVIARVAERGLTLRTPPRRLCLPDSPTPTSPALAAHYYPRAVDLATMAAGMTGARFNAPPPPTMPLDIPDASFTGPF